MHRDVYQVRNFNIGNIMVGMIIIINIIINLIVNCIVCMSESHNRFINYLYRIQEVSCLTHNIVCFSSNLYRLYLLCIVYKVLNILYMHIALYNVYV